MIIMRSASNNKSVRLKVVFCLLYVDRLYVFSFRKQNGHRIRPDLWWPLWQHLTHKHITCYCLVIYRKASSKKTPTWYWLFLGSLTQAKLTLLFKYIIITISSRCKLNFTFSFWIFCKMRKWLYARCSFTIIYYIFHWYKNGERLINT